MVWLDYRTLQLIQLVSDQPLLWVPSVDYSAEMKESAFSEIADTLKYTALEVTTKWRILIKQYRKEMRKVKTSGNSYQPTWFAYEHMRFLDNPPITFVSIKEEPIEKLNINSLCRSCMRSNEVLFDVFSTNIGTKNLLGDTFLLITGISIDRNDELPTTICGNCKSVLEGLVQFREQANRVQNDLKSLLDESQKQTILVEEIKLEEDKLVKPKLKKSNLKDVLKQKQMRAYYSQSRLMKRRRLREALNIPKYYKFDVKVMGVEDMLSTGKTNLDPATTTSIDKGDQKKDACEKKKPKQEEAKLCTLCGKIFKGGFARHIASHANLKRYKCKECEKQFSSSTTLLHHINIHHLDPEQQTVYKCQTCNKTFVRKQALQIHEVRVHKEKPLKCSHCEKRCTTKDELHRHFRIHSGVRPFQCDQCDKNYTVKHGLEHHIKTAHEGLKFQCKFCPKGFGVKSSLQYHENLHTNHRPYKCSECPEAFPNPLYLQRHTKKSHTSKVKEENESE